MISTPCVSAGESINNILINCVLGVYTGPHGPSEGLNSIKRNIFYFTTNVRDKLLIDQSGYAPGKIDFNIFYSNDPDGLHSFLVERQNIDSDPNSLIANPCFCNLEKLNLSWNKDSPAKGLGIVNIEIEKIGLISYPSIKRLSMEGGLEISGCNDLKNLIIG